MIPSAGIATAGAHFPRCGHYLASNIRPSNRQDSHVEKLGRSPSTLRPRRATACRRDAWACVPLAAPPILAFFDIAGEAHAPPADRPELDNPLRLSFASTTSRGHATLEEEIRVVTRRTASTWTASAVWLARSTHRRTFSLSAHGKPLRRIASSGGIAPGFGRPHAFSHLSNACARRWPPQLRPPPVPTYCLPQHTS